MGSIKIKVLSNTEETHAMLDDMLIETVAAGGSVSFMHPLAPGTAGAFWEKSLDAATRGERVVLGAWDGEALVGTVTLLLDCPPNQPHRAEIAKLMTRVDHRGKGVATRLMRAAEDIAVEKGRTLLVLDPDWRDTRLCTEASRRADRHAHLLEAHRPASLTIRLC